MNKYLNLSWCLLLILGVTSCDTEDDLLQTKSVGGHAVLSERSISVFDTNEDLNINFFTQEGVTAESVEIVQGGEVIGSGTVSGETATFNTSILGALEPDSYPIFIRTTYSNGDVSENPTSVSVDHAISVGDNPAETNMDSLPDVKLSYEIETFGATVNDVMLEVKEGSEGTYTDTSLNLSIEGEAVALSSIDLNALGIDLQENDTLYYRFTATSGTLTDTASSSLAVTPKAFTTSGSGTLSSDAEMSDLTLDLEYLDPTGFQAAAESDIDFVKVSDDYFEGITEDVISAREAYMAGGSALTSYINVDNGDVFVYSATRTIEDEDGNTEEETVYGIIKIGSVSSVTVDGETTDSYTVSYTEGS
jgi:hypothetical protein